MPLADSVLSEANNGTLELVTSHQCQIHQAPKRLIKEMNLLNL